MQTFLQKSITISLILHGHNSIVSLCRLLKILSIFAFNNLINNYEKDYEPGVRRHLFKGIHNPCRDC